MSGVLKGKVAIITGASRGFGKVFALRFAEEGAKLLLTTTSLERAKGTVKEVKAKGGEVAIMEADISHEDAGKKIAEKVMQQYGRVDILVNNAALWFGVNAKPWDVWTVKEWDQMFTVNVRGNWLVCKAIAPLMIKQKKGKIINIASDVFKSPDSQWFLPYALTKSAIYTMTQSLAAALGPHGINVNAVAPGYTATEASVGQEGSEKLFEMVVAAQLIKRREEPEDVVGAVVFLASPESDLITGQTIMVNGGHLVL
ncbi:MAG: SDR family oxidoreductase [Dehalococcoidia bacterium]|nr:SDR family oxidoreductase [Dehalococcoidia bacterium]